MSTSLINILSIFCSNNKIESYHIQRITHKYLEWYNTSKSKMKLTRNNTNIQAHKTICTSNKLNAKETCIKHKKSISIKHVCFRISNHQK